MQHIVRYILQPAPSATFVAENDGHASQQAHSVLSVPCNNVSISSSVVSIPIDISIDCTTSTSVKIYSNITNSGDNMYDIVRKPYDIRLMRTLNTLSLVGLPFTHTIAI